MGGCAHGFRPRVQLVLILDLGMVEKCPLMAGVIEPAEYDVNSLTSALEMRGLLSRKNGLLEISSRCVTLDGESDFLDKTGSKRRQALRSLLGPFTVLGSWREHALLVHNNNRVCIYDYPGLVYITRQDVLQWLTHPPEQFASIRLLRHMGEHFLPVVWLRFAHQPLQTGCPFHSHQ